MSPATPAQCVLLCHINSVWLLSTRYIMPTFSYRRGSGTMKAGSAIMRMCPGCHLHGGSGVAYGGSIVAAPVGWYDSIATSLDRCCARSNIHPMPISVSELALCSGPRASQTPYLRSRSARTPTSSSLTHDKNPSSPLLGSCQGHRPF